MATGHSTYGQHDVGWQSTTTVLCTFGSSRAGSTKTAVLATAVAMPPPGASAVTYRGMAALPHFDPDHDCDPLPAAVADLRAALQGGVAMLFCVPENAGALPGP